MEIPSSWQALKTGKKAGHFLEQLLLQSKAQKVLFVPEVTFAEIVSNFLLEIQPLEPSRGIEPLPAMLRISVAGGPINGLSQYKSSLPSWSRDRDLNPGPTVYPPA